MAQTVEEANYAFDTLKVDAVYSIIRDTNTASQHVAQRNGMTVVDRGIKHYRGVDMPHLLYEIKKGRKWAFDGLWQKMSV